MQTCATDGTGSVGSEKTGQAGGRDSEKADQPEGHGSEKAPAGGGSDFTGVIRQVLSEPLPCPFILHKINRTLFASLIIMPQDVLSGKAVFFQKP